MQSHNHLIRKLMLMRLDSSLKAAARNDNDCLDGMICAVANDNGAFKGQLEPYMHVVSEIAALQFAKSALLVHQAKDIAKRLGVDLKESMR